MSQNILKPKKRLWCLAIFNIAITLVAFLVNFLFIYPYETNEHISYFWVHPYPTFLFLAIVILSVGMLFGGNKWRIALIVLMTLYCGEKIVDQIYFIVTRYDSMVDSILEEEIIATLIISFELLLNYIILFSKRSNEYFSGKSSER